MNTTDKPDSVAATLRAARALIEDPKRWIKGAEAQTSKRGLWVPAAHPYAGAWCMIGALNAVDGPYEADAIAFLRQFVPGGEIARYNDNSRRRHKDVLAKFDEAIAAAEQAAMS